MNRSIIALLLLAITFSSISITFAADPPAKNVIKEGTPVAVTLMEKVSSGKTKKGTRIDFQVTNDIRSDNGDLLIRAGTPAVGTVLYSSHSGLFGRSGKLSFTCDYVLLPDGSRLKLRAKAPADVHGSSNKAGAIAAAVILTPIAFLWKGGNVWTEPGQKFTMYADETSSVSVLPEAKASSPAAPAGK